MYLEKTWTCGNRIEVKKYHTFRYNSNQGKSVPKKKKTPEQIASNNRRARKEKLERKMVANFESGFLVTLGYAGANRPKSAEEAIETQRQLMKELRKAYKKMGVQFKYIGRWEINPFHMHIVMSEPENVHTWKQMKDFLEQYWKLGNVNVKPLFPNRDYTGLVNYWFKQTEEGNVQQVENYPFRQEYFCSRNLINQEDEEHCEKKEVKANSWRETPKVPERLRKLGYVMETVQSGEDAFGYPYLRYIMVNYDYDKRKGELPWEK